MSSFVRHIFFLLLLLCGIEAQGQLEKLKFQSYNTSDGLSQTHVLTIFQDSKGYMWFGTYNGLNRFDGKNFKVYQLSQSDTNTLSGNWIKYITEDKNGNLWIATYTSGINKLNLQSEKITRYQFNKNDVSSISSNETYQVCIDDKGLVWVATAGGLCKYDERKDNFTRYECKIKNKPYVDANIVYAIHEIDSDTLLLGTEADELILFSRKSEVFNYIDYKPRSWKTSGNYAKVIARDKNHNIWIGAINHGLYKINLKTRSSTFFKPAKDDKHINSLNIRSLYVDDKNNVWIGTDGGGLNIFKSSDSTFIKHEFRQYRKFGLTSGRGIYSIFEDKDGRMWLGLYNGGVCYYDPYFYKFKSYYHDIYDDKSLSENAILSMFQDSKGRIWIGTDGGGLNLFNKEKDEFVCYKHNPSDRKSIASNVITAINEDSDGNLLLGTWNEGFMIFSPEKGLIKQYQTIPGDTTSLPHDDVWSIVKDHDGNIWLGTLKGGLAMFDPETGKFEQYGQASKRKNKPLHYDIRTMFVDKDGIVWLGTLRAGVNYFDPKTKKFEYLLHDEDDPNSLSKNDVRTIFQDKYGNMWFGTNGGGLNKYNKTSGKFELFTTDDNLPGDAIQGIQEDNHGNLWISTTNGICRFNPVRKRVRNYNINDGLQGNDFKYNASLKTDDGYIMFGGIEGLSIFHPDHITENTKKPQIVFTDFRINNVSVKIGDEDSPLKKHIDYIDELKLTYWQKSFSVEFAALNYTVPGKNQYAYRLDNFDKKWQKVGNNNVATYTNLDPGEYTLWVIASNNDDKWNMEGRKLKIIILKPFWAKWWFIALMVLIGLLITYVFYELRVYRIKSRNIELERLVDKRTSEIMEMNSELKQRTTELNEINVLLEIRQQKIEEQTEILKKQKQQLEEFNSNLVALNATKDKFFSIIAHDLRNPFNALVGFLDMLVEKYDSWNDEKRIEIIDLIRRDILKTFGLLENLLEWSRSQRGILSYNPEPVDLKETIDDVLTQFDATANSKSITTINLIDADTPLVLADKHLLNTILRNLISNAVKFTEEGGYVKVEAQNSNGVLEIIVMDNGVGISAKSLEKLFKIDQQHSTYGTNDEKGSGLGLILCKEFIKKLNGRIWVISEVGKGTEFHFTLPKA